MIARFHVLVPFNMNLPKDEEFQLWDYEDTGVRVRIYPPVKSDAPLEKNPDSVVVDGRETLTMNTLRIDFFRDHFERSRGKEIETMDPPVELIKRALDGYIERLRFVTGAAAIRTIPFPQSSWNLEYLDDDENPFEESETDLRGLGSLSIALSWAFVDAEIWEEVNKLGPDFKTPVWISLLLDARHALPDIGPAIVLAHTAIEVCASHVLQSTAVESGISEDLWKWINDRGNWMKEPSTEEQLDTLMNLVLGASLKSEVDLWKGFKRLRKARNTFVHDGVATIGGTEVSIQEAMSLAGDATKIIDWIGELLPEDKKWPDFRRDFQVRISKKIPLADDEASAELEAPPSA